MQRMEEENMVKEAHKDMEADIEEEDKGKELDIVRDRGGGKGGGHGDGGIDGGGFITKFPSMISQLCRSAS